MSDTPLQISPEAREAADRVAIWTFPTREQVALDCQLAINAATEKAVREFIEAHHNPINTQKNKEIAQLESKNQQLRAALEDANKLIESAANEATGFANEAKQLRNEIARLKGQTKFTIMEQPTTTPTPRTDAEFVPVSRKYLSPFEHGYNEGISERCSLTANHYVKDRVYQFCSVEHDAWNEGFKFGKRKKDFARTIEQEIANVKSWLDVTERGFAFQQNQADKLEQELSEVEAASAEYIVRTDEELFCSEELTCGTCRGCLIKQRDEAKAELNNLKIVGEVQREALKKCVKAMEMDSAKRGGIYLTIQEFAQYDEALTFARKALEKTKTPTEKTQPE